MFLFVCIHTVCPELLSGGAPGVLLSVCFSMSLYEKKGSVPHKEVLTLEMRKDEESSLGRGRREFTKTTPAHPGLSSNKQKENGPEERWHRGQRVAWEASPYTSQFFWDVLSTVESVKDLLSLTMDSSVNIFRILEGRDLRNREWKLWAATT